MADESLGDRMTFAPNAHPHKPRPEYFAATHDEYDRGIDYWVSRYCKFCKAPIQRQGIFRRWRHVK